MPLTIPPIMCKLNRHKPNKSKAKWDGDSYVSNCIHCATAIRRESKGVWRKEWMNLAIVATCLGLSTLPGCSPARAAHIRSQAPLEQQADSSCSGLAS